MNYIVIPKDGPSDSTVKIISNSKSNGEQIKKDELILEYETSKAIFELRSEYDGYITYFYEEEEEIPIGEPICVIDNQPIEIDSLKNMKQDLGIDLKKETNDKLISKKAITLIKKHNLNIDDFDSDFINENIVLDHLGELESHSTLSNELFKEEDVLLYGIGGHAGMCIDILKAQDKYNLRGFIDDNTIVDNKYNLKYYGGYDNINTLKKMGLKNIIIGMGMLKNLRMRDKLFDNLKTKFTVPTIIHPSAIIEDSAEIKKGCQIMAGSIIGSNVIINENCIINSGSIISHDSVIGRSSHITPGATIAGHVKIGKRVIVGMCATIYIACTISDDKIIKNNENIIVDQ